VGVLRGLPALLGVAAGMALLVFVVAFGLGAVILANPILLTGVKWCGAGVLCWLAWKIATAGRTGDAEGGKPIGFLGMTAFQRINPKAWLVCAGAAATFLHQGAGSALGQSAALALTFALVSLPSCFPWLACGAVLQRFLRSERAARIFNVGLMRQWILAPDGGLRAPRSSQFRAPRAGFDRMQAVTVQNQRQPQPERRVARAVSAAFLDMRGARRDSRISPVFNGAMGALLAASVILIIR
jgi:threonine/homoserine/homoserine lactone efflux protein